MSFPGFARRLFQNEGAGPLLRKEIIPETITKDDILNFSQESTQSVIDKYFPQRCRMFFQQEKAPSGWAKVTTYNDCAIRLVNGSIANRTNGNAFSSCFAAGRGTTSVSISMGRFATMPFTRARSSCSAPSVICGSPAISPPKMERMIWLALSTITGRLSMMA